MELSSVRCIYRFGLLAGLIFCLVCAIPVTAQQNKSDSFAITVTVDQERITVGDAFEYFVTVVSPLEAAVRWPEAGNTLSGFDILSFDHDGPYTRPDSTHADTLRYTLTTYTTGVQTIPPLSLSCVLSDGTELFVVSDSILITIVSVIEDEATDIRDLKSQVDIPLTTPWYIWAAGGVGILLLVGVIWYIIHRRRKHHAYEAFVESVRPPHERALDELDQLDRFQWLTQGRVKTHYSALSEITRRYLSERYNIAAMEYTTTELIEVLPQLEMQDEQVHDIELLLQECDMVKFAKFTPDADPQSQSVQYAREIIEHTKLVETELTEVDVPPTEEVTVPSDDAKQST